MKTLALCATMAIVSIVALPAASSAQSLQNGTWTGTMTPPGQGPVDVTYVVEGDGSSLSITISPPPGMGATGFAVDNIHVDDDAISFSFAPGTAVECELASQDDGSYMGDCVDSSGSTGHLMMVPPADE